MVAYTIIMMKTRTITIRPDQEEWIARNTINLSRFVQKYLDEVMSAGFEIVDR